MDDTALLVDFLRVKRQPVRPVVQDEQARVDDRLADNRHVRDVVDCLVNRRIGIEIDTKLDTDGLKVGNHVVALEILRPVETHVLKEMGQTALVVLLKD